MTPLSIILIVGFVILIVILLTLIFLNKYKPYELPKPNTDTMELVYSINSPWGWDEKSRSAPVEGDTGICSIYTFTSNSRFTPAKISFNDLNTCVTNNRCTYTPAIFPSCIDEDQILANERQHICQGNTGVGIDGTIKNQAVDVTNNKCLQQNGQLADPGVIERYFQKCIPKNENSGSSVKTESNNEKCPGSLSIIAFNVNKNAKGDNIFNNAVCIVSPEYLYVDGVYQNLTPLTQGPCDMSALYKNYPSQLFRVQRASFNGRDFIQDQNGFFMRIQHRPTNYVVVPLLIDNINNSSLTLVPIGTTVTTKGYWWILNPEFNLPDTNLSTIPQITYINDPKLVPSFEELDKLWAFFITKFSIQIETNSVFVSRDIYSIPNSTGVLKMKPFITYDKLNYNPYGVVAANFTQYLDYAILPYIMRDPSIYVI